LRTSKGGIEEKKKKRRGAVTVTKGRGGEKETPGCSTNKKSYSQTFATEGRSGRRGELGRTKRVDRGSNLYRHESTSAGP